MANGVNVRFKSEALKNELKDYIKLENTFLGPGKKLSISKVLQYAGYEYLKLRGWEFSNEIDMEDLPDLGENFKFPQPRIEDSKNKQESKKPGIREEIETILLNHAKDYGPEITKEEFRAKMAVMTGSYSDNALNPRWAIAKEQFLLRAHGSYYIDDYYLDSWGIEVDDNGKITITDPKDVVPMKSEKKTFVSKQLANTNPLAVLSASPIDANKEHKNKVKRDKGPAEDYKYNKYG